MISLNGLYLIQHFESLKLTAYRDSAGILTIGWGSTRNVSENQKITKAEAIKRLIEDIKIAEERVDRYVFVVLPQHQRDALISQAFNLTTKSFKRLVTYMQTDLDLYYSKLLLYCKDITGKKLLGLERRRKAERDLFQGKVWADIKKELK